MQKQEVEVFSGAVNSVVLRTPGRKYPGLLIQGDTFFSFYALAKRIYDLARALGNEELLDLAEQFEEDLRSRLGDYEKVLREHNLGLPYVSPWPMQEQANG